MEASNSTFEVILSNPGLQYIGENILKHLDIKSVANCREVSSSFLDLIDGQKFWYIEQIKKMNNAKGKQTNRSTGTSLIKEFTSIFKFEKILLDAFDDRKTLTELKIVAKFMTKYLAENDFTNSPFYQAFKEGQIDFIKLFINSPLIDFTKTDGQGFTVFHHACSQGSKEVVELLIQEFHNVDETEDLLDQANESEWSDFSDEESDEDDEALENPNPHGIGNPLYLNFLNGDIEFDSNDEDEVYIRVALKSKSGQNRLAIVLVVP